MREVFVTGGTGYMGTRLIPRLGVAGCGIRALVRPGSEGRLPGNATAVLGNALDRLSVARAIGKPDVVVHLVGVAHPGPAKGREFREIDLPALEASVSAARNLTPRPHFVFVSVAQPAPVMRAYVGVRQECEALIRQAGLSATILRPWYVLGPGHRWPVGLMPFYWMAERIPGTREQALRLGLVRLGDMLDALEWAALGGSGVDGVRVLDVAAIRSRSYRDWVNSPAGLRAPFAPEGRILSKEQSTF